MGAMKNEAIIQHAKKTPKKLPVAHRHYCPSHKAEWIHQDQRCDRVRVKVCDSCWNAKPQDLKPVIDRRQPSTMARVSQILREPMPESPNLGEVLGLKPEAEHTEYQPEGAHADVKPALDFAVTSKGRKARAPRSADVPRTPDTAPPPPTPTTEPTSPDIVALVEQAKRDGKRRGAQAVRAAREAGQTPRVRPNAAPASAPTLMLVVQPSRKTPGMVVGYLKIALPGQTAYHRLICAERSTADEVQAVATPILTQYQAMGAAPPRFTPGTPSLLARSC